MNVPQHRAPGELLTKIPEQHHDDHAEGEADQRLDVLPADSPHLLWPDGPPHDGRGEEGVDTGTCEAEGRLRGADVGQVYLVLQDAHADKRGDDRGHHLREEGEARRDLDVVRELEVVGEVQGVGARHVPVRLEVAHGECVALDPRAADELRQHVEGDFDARHGEDDAHGNDKHETEGHAVEDDAHGRVGRVRADADAAEDDGEREADHVPPLGDLRVGLHETVVDVEDAALFDLLLLGGTVAVDQVAEAHGDLAPVVEQAVRHGGRVHAEEEHVYHGIGRGEVGRGVCAVLVLVHDAAVVQDGCDVVPAACVIVGKVGVDR